MTMTSDQDRDRPIDMLRAAGIEPASVRAMLGDDVHAVTFSRWLNDDPRAGKHTRMLFRALCAAMAKLGAENWPDDLRAAAGRASKTAAD